MAHWRRSRVMCFGEIVSDFNRLGGPAGLVDEGDVELKTAAGTVEPVYDELDTASNAKCRRGRRCTSCRTPRSRRCRRSRFRSPSPETLRVAAVATCDYIRGQTRDVIVAGDAGRTLGVLPKRTRACLARGWLFRGLGRVRTHATGRTLTDDSTIDRPRRAVVEALAHRG